MDSEQLWESEFDHNHPYFSIYRSFQTFDTNQTVDPGSYGASAGFTSYYDPNAYAAPDPIYDGGNSDFDNEPPLLEGIFFLRSFILHSIM